MGSESHVQFRKRASRRPGSESHDQFRKQANLDENNRSLPRNQFIRFRSSDTQFNSREHASMPPLHLFAANTRLAEQDLHFAPMKLRASPNSAHLHTIVWCKRFRDASKQIPDTTTRKPNLSEMNPTQPPPGASCQYDSRRATAGPGVHKGRVGRGAARQAAKQGPSLQ